jgi:hypothetical protein
MFCKKFNLIVFRPCHLTLGIRELIWIRNTADCFYFSGFCRFEFLSRAGYLIVEKIFEEPLLDYDIAFKDDLTKVPVLKFDMTEFFY